MALNTQIKKPNLSLFLLLLFVRFRCGASFKVQLWNNIWKFSLACELWAANLVIKQKQFYGTGLF